MPRHQSTAELRYHQHDRMLAIQRGRAQHNAAYRARYDIKRLQAICRRHGVLASQRERSQVRGCPHRTAGYDIDTDEASRMVTFYGLDQATFEALVADLQAQGFAFDRIRLPVSRGRTSRGFVILTALSAEPA